MLKSLTYSVTFTHPERTISRDLNFERGLTTIVGPNGSGKSLNLEMIQYALFGTKALRGVMDDYKKLEVTLVFGVNGETYGINRSLKKVELVRFHGGDLDYLEDLASGNSAVNSAILDIFGYSYDVFQVANVASQGKIEALGNMRPTERKKLVDETIGLNALDELQEFIQEQIRNLNAELKAREAALVQPVEPQNPGVLSSATYEKTGRELQTLQVERNAFKAILNKPAPSKPVEVTPAADANKKEEYLEQTRKHEALVTEKILLTKELNKLPDTKYSDAPLHTNDSALEMYQESEETKRKLQAILASLLPAPSYTAQELKQEEEKHKTLERWKAKKKLMEKSVSHQCPACNHEWEEVDNRVHSEFGDVPNDPPAPELTLAEIRTEWAKIENLPRRKEIQQELTHFQTDFSPLIAAILKAREEHKKSEEARRISARRQELEERNEEVKRRLFNTPSRKDELDRLWENEMAVARYQEQKAAYDQAIFERMEAEREVQRYPDDLDFRVAVNQTSYQKALKFEMEYERYLGDQVEYLNKRRELEATRTQLLDWQNGKKAIVDLRARVKGFLLPSLNTVASHLISEMTGGVLSWIVVNEEFEITVEGQKLETLSGSGKAVANLALRIALGQILTNKVFSVALLDEIDASCDSDRSSYIAECLQKLTGRVDQIIQVSHKQDLPADHQINLGA